MMITRTDFLYRARLDDATLEVWISEEWLSPQRTDTELRFSEADLARATLIRELQHDLGVNREGVGVILNLVDQLHGLRRALAGKLGPSA
ncbi:chaperone modulator CbpM [Aestuariivirga sp.]|uniref:chaperone modulator CbpM n=1 Tax=Aestuariivirga sp. TaxID=2650926 RepID=UPI003593B582